LDANASGPAVAEFGLEDDGLGDGGGTILLRLNKFILKKKEF
jgi:hypothetical protein